MYKSDGGETMLLLNKTLLRLARGLWQWILAIAAVSFLTLVGTTALAEIVSQFLGSLFEPQVVLSTVKSAVGAAFLASVFTFLAQLVKGLIEYKTAAKARSTMRKTIFSKVMELDAGGIEEYRSVTPQQFRTNIAMVPQQVNLFSGTIRENLLLADPNANDEKLKEALSEAGLGSFLKTLPKGLDSDVGNAGAALSGGQRQKMGIARALLSEAQYMIFDEATSSVDPQSEREIWETIGRLSKTRTLIIISHRMSTIQNANCIYVLEKGVVAQRGSHAELMQQGGLYRELVTRQQAMEVAE